MNTHTLADLFAAHTAALAAYDACPDTEWGIEVSRNASQTRTAILEQRPTTLTEIAAKAAFMSAHRSFTEWDDFDQAKLIHALTPVPEATDDPLLAAITAYRSAMADFDANAPGDNDGAVAYAEASYAPAMRAIEGWDAPASTRAGALAALEMANEELKDFASSDMVPPLVTAAYAYLKKAGDAMTSLREIDGLISVHASTWLTLGKACEAADNATGTAIAAAEEALAKASDATADAISAIVEHPYSSLDELKRGMAYVVEHHRATGDGDLDAWLTGMALHLCGLVEEDRV